MPTLAELIAQQRGGTTQGTPVRQPSSGTPISLDIRQYQQPSTANAGSTTQQKQTPQQIIQSATGGYSGGQTRLPSQNQTNLPQSGNQIVQNVVGNMQPNQGSTYNPNQPNPYQGMSFGGQDTSQAQNTYRYVPPPLSKEQSAGTAKSYGLQGIADNQFTGMTQSQANQAANKKREELKAQVSAGTSYSFNPQAISGFNSKVNDLKTKVDGVNNDTWQSPSNKKSTIDSTVKSFTDQLSGGFNTVEEFQNAINTNPEFDKSISEYQRMGGDVNNILGAIQQKQQAVEGGYTNNGTQSLTDFINPKSKAEQQAYQSLIPEQKSLQMQIAFENGIVDKYNKYYFGDENQIGLSKQKKQQAIEKATILENQVKLAADNAKAKSDLSIQKEQADMEAADAEIEENGITAKNYMTGMLAKLGALNTTGAAGEALVKIDLKYQKLRQSSKQKYQFMMKDTEVKLGETLNDIDSKKMESMFKIKEDLSKDEETVVKEMFKLETDATRKSFDAVDKYLGMYRTQKDKYIKEAKDLAEANAKRAASAMSSYNLSGLSFDKFGKTSAGQTYTGDTNNPLVNAVIKNISNTVQSNYLNELKNSGALSPETQAVISGEETLMSLTEAGRKRAEKELKTLGVNSTMLPKANDKTKEFGALSPADSTKGLNYLYTNPDATPDDIDKFKSGDRAFQAYILDKAN